MTSNKQPRKTVTGVGEDLAGLEAQWLRRVADTVRSTGADTLSLDEIAGMLLGAVSAPAAQKEAWRERGAAFFRRGRGRNPAASRGAPPQDQAQPGAHAPS
jgi:hypothetical protein